MHTCSCTSYKVVLTAPSPALARSGTAVLKMRSGRRPRAVKQWLKDMVSLIEGKSSKFNKVELLHLLSDRENERTAIFSWSGIPEEDADHLTCAERKAEHRTIGRPGALSDACLACEANYCLVKQRSALPCLSEFVKDRGRRLPLRTSSVCPVSYEDRGRGDSETFDHGTEAELQLELDSPHLRVPFLLAVLEQRFK